eukprot:gene81-4330_t
MQGLKQVSSFGVTTSHTKNILPSVNNKIYQIDAPIGPTVVTWDIKEKRRVNFLHAHEHIVTSMERSPNDEYISTTCFGGVLKIWNNEWKEMSDSLQILKGSISFSHWSRDGNFILTLSRSTGTLSLISVEKSKNGRLHLKLEGTKIGNYTSASFTKSGNILTIEEYSINSKMISMATLTDKKFKLIQQKEILQQQKIYMLGNDENHSIFALKPEINDQKLMLLDAENLTILCEINANIKVKTVLFNEDFFYISNNSNTIQCYSIDGKFIKEYKIPKLSIRTLVWSCKKEKMIWIVAEEGLKHFRLDSYEDTVLSVSLHSLTCCGVDISENGKYLVSGDFKGNVILWDIVNHHSIKEIQLKSAIRCLRWKRNSNWIQIGCLDGSILNWNIENDKLQKILKIRSKIICMDWENSENPSRLAIGTKDGHLIILQENQNIFKKVLNKVSHPPIKGGEKNGRFGTIGMYSEVWSLKWSPNNNFIATSSEDQTTKIWNLKGELIQTLSGHTTAVTSVDWSLSSNGEILVTCADDKRIMIWNVSSWELHHEFNTYHIEGWHTLTYLALDKSGDQLITTTQNGYLVIWCLKTKKEIFQAKIHSGSIEGLKWNHNSSLIGTVSSDCTINVFDSTNLISNF